MWTCPKCASKIDPAFEVCWNCGTSPDGIPDPNFVPADQAGPIEDPPVTPELNVDAAPALADELPGPAQGELVECYSAFDLMEAKFLADQLSEAGIPAVSDTHDMHGALGGMSATPRVWVREDDLLAARAWLANYEQNKAVDG
ncbi:DUF2007 domain-containing protein [Tundrisphaera sp. TA3]|uniref:putative signal transducing protein n=1 Tax=Tundrisphaera sp. TA3 TaxID=3435775 RepID=UPI003EB77CA1